MTLSISPTRSGLTTTIVCRGCEHLVANDTATHARVEWTDTNDDTYFTGSTPDALRSFLDRHEGKDHEIVPSSSVHAHPHCQTCGRPIRASDSDPWTWQHA